MCHWEGLVKHGKLLGRELSWTANISPNNLNKLNTRLNITDFESFDLAKTSQTIDGTCLNRVRCMVRGSFRVRPRELRVEVRHRCVMKVGTYKVH